MAQAPTLSGKEAVLQGLPEHPAVKAILHWNAEALTDAKFDFGELSLTIASAEIRAACSALQKAGYNFFEDMTAVRLVPCLSTLPAQLPPALARVQRSHPPARHARRRRSHRRLHRPRLARS